eukprot:9787574-Alexandrium_andersonii.AAC.1
MGVRSAVASVVVPSSASAASARRWATEPRSAPTAGQCRMRRGTSRPASRPPTAMTAVASP